MTKITKAPDSKHKEEPSEIAKSGANLHLIARNGPSSTIKFPTLSEALELAMRVSPTGWSKIRRGILTDTTAFHGYPGVLLDIRQGDQDNDNQALELPITCDWGMIVLNTFGVFVIRIVG
jgi:hypothetical protein